MAVRPPALGADPRQSKVAPISQAAKQSTLPKAPALFRKVPRRETGPSHEAEALTGLPSGRSLVTRPNSTTLSHP
jgi:hypothetical protein